MAKGEKMNWLLLVLVVLGITLLHELTHLAVARHFGYRPLAWGPAAWGPIILGAFVIFDDTFEPNWSPFYWPLQLIIPLLLTAAALPLAWLVVFHAAGLDWITAARVAIHPALLILSLLVSASGSLGDLLLVLAMPRLAATEADLTLRDFKTHRSFGARPIFTRHGRDALYRRYQEEPEKVWARAQELPPISIRSLLQRRKR